MTNSIDQSPNTRAPLAENCKALASLQTQFAEQISACVGPADSDVGRRESLESAAARIDQLSRLGEPWPELLQRLEALASSCERDWLSGCEQAGNSCCGDPAFAGALNGWRIAGEILREFLDRSR